MSSQMFFVICEPHLLPEKSKLHFPSWPISVFAHQNFNRIFVRLRIEERIPIQHHHLVCILFNTSAFPKIAEPRSLIFPHLTHPIQLRKDNHRNVELLRQELQLARHVRDLAFSVVAFSRGAHELEIIHSEKIKTTLRFHSSGDAGQLRDCHVPRVFNHHLVPGQLSRCDGEPLPLIRIRKLLKDGLQLYPRNHRVEAIHELETAHFKRAPENSFPVRRGAREDMSQEGRFPATRTSRDDAELRLLKSP